MANKQRPLSDFRNTPRINKQFPEASIGSPYEIGQDPRPEIIAEIKELERQRGVAEDKFNKYLNVVESQQKSLQREIQVLLKKKNQLSDHVKDLYSQAQRVAQSKKNLEAGLDKYAVYFLKIVFAEARQAFDSAQNKLKEAEEEKLTAEQKKALVDEAMSFLTDFDAKLTEKENLLIGREQQVKKREVEVEKQKAYLAEKETKLNDIIADSEAKLAEENRKLKDIDKIHKKAENEFAGKKESLVDFRKYLDSRAKILNAVEAQNKRKEQALNEKEILLQDRQETLDRTAKELNQRALDMQ